MILIDFLDCAGIARIFNVVKNQLSRCSDFFDVDNFCIKNFSVPEFSFSFNCFNFSFAFDVFNV